MVGEEGRLSAFIDSHYLKKGEGVSSENACSKARNVVSEFIAESSVGLSKATVLERKEVVILMHVLLFIVDPRKRFKCFLWCCQSNAEKERREESLDGQHGWSFVNSRWDCGRRVSSAAILFLFTCSQAQVFLLLCNTYELAPAIGL